jgi:hypothetical protein
VPRLILLCERPRHLGREESVVWLRQATQHLVDGSDVVGLQFTELESPSPHWSPAGDWLLEAELADDVDVRRLIDTPQWREVLADLRLLGMRPALAVADARNSSRLGPAA